MKNSQPQIDRFWPYPWVVAICTVIFSFFILLALRAHAHVDIAISDMFFSSLACDQVGTYFGSNPKAARCGLFEYSLTAWARPAQWVVITVTRVAVIGLIVWIIWVACLKRRRTPQDYVAPAYCFLALLMGPLLFIIFFLKEVMGRPRPYQTLDFGGYAKFTLPADLSAACQTNCSFPSGEAAGAFWLLVFVPLLPQRWRIPGGVIILLFAIFASFTRVSFGRHYFSDVTMSACITIVSIVVAAALVQSGPASRLFEKWSSYSNRTMKRWEARGYL